MVILRAGEEDLPDILELQYLAYQSEARLLEDPQIPPLTQTLKDVRAEFVKGVFLKAVDDAGVIIGSVRAWAQAGTAFIGKLIVQPDRQGRGIGTALLCEIEKAFPGHRYELFTSSRSVRNLELYERLGYTRFREREIKPGLTMVFLEKAPE